MDNNSHKIKAFILHNKEAELTELLNTGINPNFDGGWPIRLASRHGFYSIVKLLIQYGADPNMLSESGASTLQLAVYAGKHWDTDKWAFLLSCCDSSQLADAAAVAIIFGKVEALNKILETGRCNTNVPTTLTGKTVEHLAKGYKLSHLINVPIIQYPIENSPLTSPRITRQNMQPMRATLSPQRQYGMTQRNLSPSVARFFHQTVGQSSLTPPRGAVADFSSPTTDIYF